MLRLVKLPHVAIGKWDGGEHDLSEKIKVKAEELVTRRTVTSLVTSTRAF